jgi:peptidoglycan/LPS O-acetylase OafA/YrhL
LIQSIKTQLIIAESVIPKNEERQKVFFPNLDALRFICFLMVFLFHAYKTIFENLKSGNGTSKTLYSIIQFLFQNGELGVNFFFVLSGFLITFLLIREKSYSKTVHLRNFYIRRVLRIWPLFYLCVFIGFVVSPFLKSLGGQTANEIANPLYYIFFINNFDYIQSWPSFPDALILIVLWSVAVEEQFYITWPLIVKYFSSKWYPLIFSAIILGTLLFRCFYTGSTDSDYAIRHFHTLAVIGDMALGGLMAYYCSFDSSFRRWVTELGKAYIYLIYAAAIVCILFRNVLFDHSLMIVFERLIIALFFGLVIVEQNFSKHSPFKFSSLKNISKLGLFTYGLYCLHFFVISIIQTLSWKVGLSLGTPVNTVIVCLLSLTLTLLISSITYHYFEKPFLKLKDKFAIIHKK